MNTMNRWAVSLLSISFFLAACGKGSGRLETVEVRDSIYGYTEKYTRLPDDYAKQGLYQKFSEQGLLMETAYYERDTLNGPRVVFSIKGDTQIVEHYNMGIFDGAYELFYENGQLELKGQYTANAMAGEWRRYYDNGQLSEIVQFRDNEENGPFIEYYENGNLKAEGSYLNGDNEHGELKLYDEEGKLVRIMNCNQGVCRTQWAAENGQEAVDSGQ
ncbi:MAG: toxin-antitoxin system YwqK family antitoxin [Bacteroidota bacterium]